jgi:hypothetical protein
MVFLIALADGLQPFSNACGFDVGQCGWNGPHPAIRFHLPGKSRYRTSGFRFMR